MTSLTSVCFSSICDNVDENAISVAGLSGSDDIEIQWLKDSHTLFSFSR